MSILTFNVLIVWIPVVIYSIILLAILIDYFKNKAIGRKTVSIGIIIVLTILIAKAVIQSLATYYYWKSSSFGQFLLPPYQPTYFYEYSWHRYLLPTLASIISSLILFFLIWFVSQYKKDLFLEGEKSLAFLGSLVSGWPNIIIYLGFVFILGIIYLLMARKFEKEIKLIVIAFWPTAALFNFIFW